MLVCIPSNTEGDKGGALEVADQSSGQNCELKF